MTNEQKLQTLTIYREWSLGDRMDKAITDAIDYAIQCCEAVQSRAKTLRHDIHKAEVDALKAENAELTSALGVIHELAHNESTGPVFEDGYWAIRALAGEALGVK